MKVKFTAVEWLQSDYYAPLLLKLVIRRRETARIKYFWKCSLYGNGENGIRNERSSPN